MCIFLIFPAIPVSFRWLRWLPSLWWCVAIQVQCERVDRGVAHAEGSRIPQLLRAEGPALRGGFRQHRALRSGSGLLGGLAGHAASDGQLLHHGVQRTPVCHRLSDRRRHHGHPELRRRHQPLGHGQLWTAASMVLHTKNCHPQWPPLFCQVRRIFYCFVLLLIFNFFLNYSLQSIQRLLCSDLWRVGSLGFAALRNKHIIAVLFWFDVRLWFFFWQLFELCIFLFVGMTQRRSTFIILKRTSGTKLARWPRLVFHTRLQ